MTKVIDITNYKNDRVAHAFLEFYLSLFKSDELDSLSTFNSQEQLAGINHFLEIAPQVPNEELIAKLVENRGTELTNLFNNIAATDPKVTELSDDAAWHTWYRALIKKIAVRTPGGNWNKAGTR